MTDLLQHLALGFGVALSPMNMFLCLIGAVVGNVDRRAARHRAAGDHRHAAADHLSACRRSAALIMLAGIYYGAQYGGSTTSILVQHPRRIILGRHVASTGTRWARPRPCRPPPPSSICGDRLVLSRDALSTVLVAALGAPLTAARAAVRPGGIFLADGSRSRLSRWCLPRARCSRPSPWS